MQAQNTGEPDARRRSDPLPGTLSPCRLRRFTAGCVLERHSLNTRREPGPSPARGAPPRPDCAPPTWRTACGCDSARHTRSDPARQRSPCPSVASSRCSTSLSRALSTGRRGSSALSIAVRSDRAVSLPGRIDGRFEECRHELRAIRALPRQRPCVGRLGVQAQIRLQMSGRSRRLACAVLQHHRQRQGAHQRSSQPTPRRHRAQLIGEVATRLEALAPDRQTQAGAGKRLHFPPALSGQVQTVHSAASGRSSNAQASSPSPIRPAIASRETRSADTIPHQRRQSGASRTWSSISSAAASAPSTPSSRSLRSITAPTGRRIGRERRAAPQPALRGPGPAPRLAQRGYIPAQAPATGPRRSPPARHRARKSFLATRSARW